MNDIRSLVRQILAEELGRHGIGAGGPRREPVSIRRSADLDAFALRVLEMARSVDLAAELRSGRLRFELESGSAPPARSIAETPSARASAPAGAAARFDKGLVTEKHIAGLAHGASISVGKSVCFTPLAKDELRRKGIKVERKAS